MKKFQDIYEKLESGARKLVSYTTLSHLKNSIDDFDIGIKSSGKQVIDRMTMHYEKSRRFFSSEKLKNVLVIPKNIQSLPMKRKSNQLEQDDDFSFQKRITINGNIYTREENSVKKRSDTRNNSEKKQQTQLNEASISNNLNTSAKKQYNCVFCQKQIPKSEVKRLGCGIHMGHQDCINTINKKGKGQVIKCIKC